AKLLKIEADGGRWIYVEDPNGIWIGFLVTFLLVNFLVAAMLMPRSENKQRTSERIPRVFRHISQKSTNAIGWPALGSASQKLHKTNHLKRTSHSSSHTFDCKV
ncbi:MAG TPA: hypothetical protein VEH86_07975, partial [Candidatus Acidoferrum sp.]|nr:hypothetical protein [Candidatus Acidoferrum sp.]